MPIDFSKQKRSSSSKDSILEIHRKYYLSQTDKLEKQVEKKTQGNKLLFYSYVLGFLLVWQVGYCCLLISNPDTTA